MPLTDDIANDYQLFDGIEIVTLTPRNPAGAPVSSVKALRRVQDRRDINARASAMPSDPDDLVWHLWTATLGGVVPKNGDSITDSGGNVWIVKSLAKETLGTRWRAVCRKQV